MKKLIEASDEFDAHYKKRTDAMVFGIFYGLAWLICSLFPVMTREQWFLYTLPLRIITVIWCRKILIEQNRQHWWNDFVNFCFPFIMLMIIGGFKKRTLKFTIDDTYPVERQATELRAYAQKYIQKKKYSEAIFIYQYLIKNLPHTNEDINMLSNIMSRTNIILQ